MKNVVLDETRLFGTSKLSPWGVVALIATMAILLFALAACGGAGEPTDVTETDFGADSSEDSSHDGNAGESPTSAPSSATSESSSSLSLSSSLSVESSSSFPPGVVDPSTVIMGEMVDSRDGQIYKTVTIGDQVWMAQNLNYETDDGYCYNDNASNCTRYGRLYTWTIAMDSAGTWNTNGNGCGDGVTCSPTYPVQGVCPSGWHLPDSTEWETLFIAVGGKSIAGMKLKSTGGWNYGRSNEDAYSFAAKPAGHRDSGKDFFEEGFFAEFWSSSEYDGSYVYEVHLRHHYDDAFLGKNAKHYGLSVRCVKD